MHAPVEYKLYDLSGVHHVTPKDKEIFMLVEKDYPVRRGLALVMISYKLQVKDFKGMTFEEIEAKFNMIWKQVKDFIPIGSKEEAKRYKRKGIRVDQESSKKLKSSEEVIKDVKSTKEIPEEKMKEMM
nr:hypothetical protein [Tanacetum cinerariifolium]